MNRRNFLRLFGTGLPALAVAEKIGLVERVRSYFFAPKGGWRPTEYYYDDRAYFVNAAGIWEARPDLAEITNLTSPLDLTGLPYWIDFPRTDGTFYGISRDVKLVGEFAGLPLYSDTDVPVGEIHLRERDRFLATVAKDALLIG